MIFHPVRSLSKVNLWIDKTKKKTIVKTLNKTKTNDIGQNVHKLD